jgi:short-subunit dehydrogenase
MSKLRMKNHVVVITGASSGVGRAAALAFAREGASVMLAARHAAALEEAADECRALGALADIQIVDTGDARAVSRVVATTIERFGKIDVWINNAGVGAVGEFTQTPIEAHERVIRTNLIGYVNGAHAVLPHFQSRGGGVLINTLSVGAWAASPYSVAYSASKFGLRGFSEALRGELQGQAGIHVCDVFPAFLDTPGISHAGNYTGREIKPIPPLYDPRDVADAMVALALSPRAAVTVGSAARLIRLGHFVAPGLVAGLLGRAMSWYFQRAAPTAVTPGILFEPQLGPAAIDGGYRKPRGKASQRAVPVAALVLLGAGVWALTTRRQR